MGFGLDMEGAHRASLRRGDGRGTLDANGHSVGYIVSPVKLVYIDTPAGRPRLVIVEK